MGKIKAARYASEPQAPPRSLREDLARIFLTDLTELFKREEPSEGEEGQATGVGEGDSPTTRLAEDLIRDAVRERATDIHVEPQSEGARLRLRVDGQLIDTAQITDLQCHRLVNQVKTLADLDPVRSFAPQDARFTYDLDGRLLDIRVTVVPSVTGEKIAIRLLDPIRVRQSIGDLGLDSLSEQSLKAYLRSVNGLFLVTGPTGSGKTTLLYALLHELRASTRSIVTIEDPVEYQIDGITQIQVNERHGLTFAEGIKTMLRLDPDYLMLGEVRDALSARSAVDASISGRAMMTTLHSRDAVSAISALRNWGVTNLEIAVAVSVVVAQRLVRTLCPRCREQRDTSNADALWLKSLGYEVPRQAWYPKGCDQCRNLGFVGRVGVFETWRLDAADYDLILAGADERSLRRHLTQKKHRFLMADGLDKAAAGLTALAELQTMGDFAALPA